MSNSVHDIFDDLNSHKTQIMATINLVLDKRRALKDGTYPLVFRLRIEKKFIDIATGYRILEKSFNPKTNSIDDDIEVNIQLEKLKLKYTTKLREYVIDNNHSPNLLEAKNFILSKSSQDITIEEFWIDEITSLINKGKVGNARNYKITLSAISRTINLKIPFNKLTLKMILELEENLYKRGMTANGISVYMRALRAIYNKAIAVDLASLEKYPFRKFKIGKKKTVPKVLTINELRSYFALHFDESDNLYRSHLIGKLLFLLQGINMRDLLVLSSVNIKSGRIIYKRAKTGRIYSIKLTSEMKSIFDKFQPNKDTLLGVIGDEEFNLPNLFSTIYQQKLKVINSHLRKIGKSINANEVLISYTMRYSFANTCRKLGYSHDLIGQALGHSSHGNQITSIYLEQFDNETIDEMNSKVIDEVTK